MGLERTGTGIYDTSVVCSPPKQLLLVSTEWAWKTQEDQRLEKQENAEATQEDRAEENTEETLEDQRLDKNTQESTEASQEDRVEENKRREHTGAHKLGRQTQQQGEHTRTGTRKRGEAQERRSY